MQPTTLTTIQTAQRVYEQLFGELTQLVAQLPPIPTKAGLNDFFKQKCPKIWQEDALIIEKQLIYDLDTTELNRIRKQIEQSEQAMQQATDQMNSWYVNNRITHTEYRNHLSHRNKLHYERLLTRSQNQL